MSCKLNTSNILTVTEEGEVAHAVRPDEKREELPDTTHQGKVKLLYHLLTDNHFI